MSCNDRSVSVCAVDRARPDSRDSLSLFRSSLLLLPPSAFAMPAALDGSSPAIFTVKGLIAAAKAARLPPPTVETLLHKLCFPLAITCTRTCWNLSIHDDFVDAAHPASRLPDAHFPSVISLPSLGALLSRAGFTAILALVGDTKERRLSKLKRKERVAVDEALKAFFSLEPSQDNFLQVVRRFWDVCKAVAPELPDRTWQQAKHSYWFSNIVSASSSSVGKDFSGVRLARVFDAAPLFAASEGDAAGDGTAGMRDCQSDDKAAGRLFATLEKKLIENIDSDRTVPVVLLNGSHFLPVFVLDLKNLSAAFRDEIKQHARTKRVDTPQSVSLESFGLALQDARRLISGLAPARRDYVIVYGSEAPLSASLQSDHQSLLHIIALAALDSLDELGKEIQNELLRLLRPRSVVHDHAVPSLPSATSRWCRLLCRERPAPSAEPGPANLSSSLNSHAPPVNCLPKKDDLHPTGASPVSLSRTRYRLVTFDELEQSCAFTAAFVGHDGQLVGFHRFPSSAPLNTSGPAKAASLPPTPPPTPPPISTENKPVHDGLALEPLLLLSGKRFGEGNQGYLYRAHCADSPFPFLAKSSYTSEGYDLMKDEAAFYRENRRTLEEEQLAPRCVGSWKTTGSDSPLPSGASSMKILVEEWGQALAPPPELASQMWRIVAADKEALQHMKELAMRFHLSLNYRHESFGLRNIVWKPELGLSSLRLIDFARCEKHECDGSVLCDELEEIGDQLDCWSSIQDDFRTFAEEWRIQRVKVELERMAQAQQELEEQAKREDGLRKAVSA
ncbi:hypothetical protein BJY59DRAFT_449818 [Rhodotorula toruloides]